MGQDRVGKALRLARAQGIFNVLGGAWPIVSLRTFEAIYGPKKLDVYLQKTSGALFMASGLALLRTERSEESVRAARRIGMGVAAAYLAIDLIYVPEGEIHKTYLLDAAMEIGWLAAWLRQHV
ncbi:MAG TPA: hypothetical protein VIG64_10045 [Actinomycetota bacterium]|jgi:hypothetical protein